MNKKQSIQLFTVIYIGFAIFLVIISALMVMEKMDPFDSHFLSAIVAAEGAYIVADYVGSVRKGAQDETEQDP